MFDKIIEAHDPNSLASRMRHRRFVFFRALVETLPRPLSILDIGGLPGFWQREGFADQADIHLTLLNLSSRMNTVDTMTYVSGDARAMPQFHDGQFDIVFSNSCIEHVGSFADQQRMAQEVRRVGKRYFVQTPNRHFPIEPHFALPLFQFFPRNAQIWYLSHIGLTGRSATLQRKLALVDELRLLTVREMRGLFPNGAFYLERMLGMVKSVVAYKF